MALRSVLTGDIVNSTRLPAAKGRKLVASLQQLLAPHLFEFYRGDSFQVYIKDPKLALQTALHCRTAAILASGTVACDVRISIGIGAVTTPVTQLATARGAAFVLSGRAFDTLGQGNDRLVIVAKGETTDTLNLAMQLLSLNIDTLCKEMTAKQAAVIFELLGAKTQLEVATRFKKSKSTISQLVSAARWNNIEKMLYVYEQLINNMV